MSLLDKHIEQKMTQRQIPGLSVRICRNDDHVFEREWGYADIANKTLIGKNTVFRVGCLTKPVIAITILTLAEDGLLSLDDKITKYLPALSGNDLQTFAGVTVAHLLAHRSGIARGTYYEEAPVIPQVLAEIATTKLSFEPGSEYKYSNWGYLLLGEICRNVTGMDAAEYCIKRILHPLGMNDTFFQTEDFYHDDLAKGYWDNWHFGFPDLSQPLQESKWYPIAPSASGLVSTPDDFCKLIKALTGIRDAESGNVLPANIFRQIFTKVADKGANKFTSLCLYCEEVDGREVWYFPGTNSGFSAYFFYIPALGISGVAMANRTACNNELRELLEIIIAGAWSDMPPSCLSRPPIPFEGEFSSQTGEVLRLRIGPGIVNQVTLRKKSTPLLFCSPRNYFQLDGDDRRNMIRIHTKKGEVYEVTNGAEYYRLADDRRINKRAPASSWRAFAGIYEYPAFGRVEVLLRGHRLYMNFGVIYETLLTHGEKNTFIQNKGPFSGEAVCFAAPAAPGQISPYFILNGMKFKRLD
ncbi:MAG TPA: serine hydrolase [Mucilaginibacter sp.]|nr:serine hydrolase [Mucilaginibacter sp.]